MEHTVFIFKKLHLIYKEYKMCLLHVVAALSCQQSRHQPQFFIPCAPTLGKAQCIQLQG